MGGKTMARLIDADALYAVISEWPESVMYKDWVQCAISTAPTVSAYGQWVSVKDRLPEGNGEYIVTVCDEGEPYDEKIWGDTVIVCAEYHDGAWTWEENGTEFYLNGIVTHWMPMPEPSKEDK